MTKLLRFWVNDILIERDLDDQTTLLAFLREGLGLTGTKNGCGTGHCGTCTVLIDHQPKRSCIVRLRQLPEGARIQTIEGLGGSLEALHPIQQAFVEEGAVQCGFCTPGMVMATKALLMHNPTPTDAEIRSALSPNLCRCTGYAAIVRAVQRAAAATAGPGAPAGGLTDGVQPAAVPAAAPTPAAGGPASPGKHAAAIPGGRAPAVVGTDVIRKDSPAKALGRPLFADDLPSADALIGVVALSDQLHARICSIDVDAARTAPGVRAVFTRADLPGSNLFGLYAPDQQVYADEFVFFRGEVIAVVVAGTRTEAEAARALIRVEYEPLPAAMDPEANLVDGAVPVRPDLTSNIAHHVAVRKGDVEAAFARAEVIIEGEYTTPVVEHAYLEPESCLAVPEADGGVTVWTGSQGSHAYRSMIAASLALPEDTVRVVLTACGGAFGGKEEPTVQIHAALAAVSTGRPVRMTLTRAESLRMSVKRHSTRIRMRHGLMRDGRIVAVESRVVADAGAYLSLTKPVVFRSAVTAPGPYAVETVKADSWGVFTHRTPNGAFRGFGSTQVCFAAEVQMDKAARALGIDAGELRRRNGFAAGVETATGQLLTDGVGYQQTLRAAMDGLEALRREFGRETAVEHLKIGFGLASSYKNVGIGNGTADAAGAGVALTATGRLLVTIGAADLGQGSDTVMCQIAADTLAVPYDLIDVVAGDTVLCPDGGMTTASRQTYVTGNAVLMACRALLPELDAAIAEHGGRPVDGDATHWKVVLMAVAQARSARGVPLAKREVYYPPKTQAHQTDIVGSADREHPEEGIHYAYCFVSSAVAVEVNTRNGAVRVLKVYSAQDVGKAMHPQNVRGQIEGSVAMGIGYALSEEFVETADAVVTKTLGSQHIPRIDQVPPIEAIIVEDPQHSGPFGAKGMGEVGLNPLAPAISNAIFDAVGVRLTDLPMTPERVLTALTALATQSAGGET